MSPRIALALLLLLAGCPDRGRAEADVVVDSVTRIGTAAPSARPAMLDELEARPLTDPQARTTRDTCVSAYRALADAKAKIADVAVPDADAALQRAEALGEECRLALAGLRER